MKHAKVVLDRDFVISEIDEKVFGCTGSYGR